MSRKDVAGASYGLDDAGVCRIDFLAKVGDMYHNRTDITQAFRIPNRAVKVVVELKHAGVVGEIKQ